ncbi:MAG: methyl-accepting chemotaxis protein [Rhodospirillales bacterium]|nr:methyl-accepting chemotaxis protein [Rhodospirillales bacterium]
MNNDTTFDEQPSATPIPQQASSHIRQYRAASGGKMKLGTKLFLSTGMLIAITVLLVIVALVSIADIRQTLERVIDVSARNRELGLRIEVNFLRANRAVNNLVLAKNSDQIAEALADEKEARKAVEDRLDELSQTIGGEEKRIAEEFHSAFNGYNAIFEEIRGLVVQQRVDEAWDVSVTKARVARVAATEAVHKLIELADADVKAAREDALAQYQITFWTLVGVSVGGVLLAVGLFLFILLRNIRPSLLQAVGTMAAASSEIAATTREHEKVLTQQASAVTQTTTTVEELGTSARRSAEQGNAATGLAEEAQRQAREGNAMAQAMLSSMADLKEKVGSIGEQIMRLSDQVGEVGIITGAVADIANHTNLLALNAAVEAARAGEHGKGFAVVAQEIRKLADQSKKSAFQINTLIEDVKKVLNTTVMSTEVGTKTVGEAVGAVEKFGESFSQVIASVESITENVQQMALSSNQQAGAIKQITEAMASIQGGAKQAAAGVSQTRIGVEQLSAIGVEIEAMI